MFYFYIPGGVSGVMKFYIGMLVEAFQRAGFNIEITGRLKSIPKKSNILTVSDKGATLAKIYRNPSILINWYQGITPEEMDMLYSGKWERYPRHWIRQKMEKYSLNVCTFNIFVSNAMLNHFRNKYGYDRDNYIIIPCFGNEFNKESINTQRYTVPRFLYSGSTLSWQCIDQMLELFKSIKKEIPQASLSILTPEREVATKLVKQHNVDASVDFIEPQNLQNYISQFKYGFIVREDTEVNRVATPTKMSNYMGAGIIPVYSDVILDYKANITERTHYIVPFKNPEECIHRIKHIEETGIDINLLEKDYRSIFNSYWNRESYITKLSVAIKNLF